MNKWMNGQISYLKEVWEYFFSWIFLRLELPAIIRTDLLRQEDGQNDRHSTFQFRHVVSVSGTLPCPDAKLSWWPSRQPLFTRNMRLCALSCYFLLWRVHFRNVPIECRAPMASDMKSERSWPMSGAGICLEPDSMVLMPLFGEISNEKWLSHRWSTWWAGSVLIKLYSWPLSIPMTLPLPLTFEYSIIKSLGTNFFCRSYYSLTSL